MSGQNLAISGCKFCYFVILWQNFRIYAEKTAPKVNALRAEIKLFEFNVNENLHRDTQLSDQILQCLKSFTCRAKCLLQINRLKQTC